MLTLHGVTVTAENARHIVASLFADGRPAAMSAAGSAAVDDPPRERSGDDGHEDDL